MTLVLSAVLFGITTACFSWVVVHRLQSRSALAERLSTVSSDLSFPYQLSSETSESKKSEIITLDSSYENKITRQLFLAGVRRRANTHFYQLITKLSVVFPIFFFILYSITGSLTFKNLILFALAGFTLYAYVWILIRSLKQKRQKKITKALPQFFDLLVVCLEAGLNFNSALPRVIRDMSPKEPVVKEFDHMHHELMGGLSLAQACDRLSRRCEVTDLSVILISLVQSDQMGSGLAQVLRVQAHELRDKLRQRMRERAYRIPVKLLFPMVLIFITLFTMTLGPVFLQLSNGTRWSSNAGAR